MIAQYSLLKRVKSPENKKSAVHSDSESSMDVYGQLIFIHSYAVDWNLKKYRFILVENL